MNKFEYCHPDIKIKIQKTNCIETVNAWKKADFDGFRDKEE
jgi:hypothetical protein